MARRKHSQAQGRIRGKEMKTAQKSCARLKRSFWKAHSRFKKARTDFSKAQGKYLAAATPKQAQKWIRLVRRASKAMSKAEGASGHWVGKLRKANCK